MLSVLTINEKQTKYLTHKENDQPKKINKKKTNCGKNKEWTEHR